MKTMFQTMTLVVAAGFAAMPMIAAAQTMDPATMTCAEYTAMDDAGKTAAVTALHGASPDAATPMDEAAMTAASTGLTTACEATPEATAMATMTAMPKM